MACIFNHFRRGLDSAEETNSLEKGKMVIMEKRASKISMFKVDGIVKGGVRRSRMSKMISPTCFVKGSFRGMPEAGKIKKRLRKN